MPDTFLSFLPVVAEDADSVRARFNADANAGLDPSDPSFIDTTEGGFFWDLTQPAVLECVRLWDFLGTEMVMAAFPGTAWGSYLDAHGETVNLPRNDEVAASGTVLFTGDAGTLIAAGTQVATVQPDPSSTVDPISFATDASITLMATPGPVSLTATPSATGGTLPPGVYYYVVTAIGPDGETIASNEVSVTLSGATSSVALAWSAYAGATGYNIYRGGTALAETLLASPAGTGTTYTDTGASAQTATPAPTNSVGITAQVPGSAGNVGSNTITQILSPQQGAPTVTNPQPTSGGSDVESDERYRLRILAEYGKSSGSGNISDYVKWGLSLPQVGFVTVQPLWNGAGTVRVIITDPDNHPNSASVVSALQLLLDPVAGQGMGLAPIGAIVTVTTPSLLTVAVAAQVVFQSGYSLDGAAGTVPTRATITAALNSYLNGLAPGEDAILTAVIRQIMSVPGVEDVTGPGGTGLPQLNGASTNVAVGPLQVSSAGTINLS